MLISSNAENAYLSWGTEEENWSFNYEGYVHNGIYEIFKDIKVNHFFMLFMKKYKDPRLEAFADPSFEPYMLIDTLYEAGTSGPQVAVEYPIPYLGEPLSTSGVLSAWDLTGADNPLSGLPDRSYSFIDYDNFLVADADFMFISYADVSFMKAEAALNGWGGSKTAEEYSMKALMLHLPSMLFREQRYTRSVTGSSGARKARVTGIMQVMQAVLFRPILLPRSLSSDGLHCLTRDMMGIACKKEPGPSPGHLI